VDDLEPVVIIAGPTASGKTDIAIQAAERFNGEIVNADSMQVYRELKILTARPSEADTARVPHHMFGVLAASERCSAGRWLDMAAAAIKDIHARGKLPIVAGGTGLYLKALTDGIAPIPEIPAARVQAITAHLEEIGGEAFRAELATVDADAAARLPASDKQRLVRAAAVFAETGRTLSAWQQAEPPAPGYPGRFASIILMPPREDMYAAIDARFDAMMNEGALEEARAFHALNLNPTLPASRAVGVVELMHVLDGEWTMERAIEKAKTHSRHLAKRQLTWFRRQIRTDLMVDEKYSERDYEKIFSFIRQFLLTPSA